MGEPSKSIETTPYELWFVNKPKLLFLKVWGCDTYVKRLQPDKLEAKSKKCIFIGYPKETIGYTFYHKSEGKFFVAKNGTFLEKEFLQKISELGYKCFAFGSVIEGVPHCFLRVSYEDALL